MKNIIAVIAICLMVFLAMFSFYAGCESGKVQGHNRALIEFQKEVMDIPSGQAGILKTCTDIFVLYTDCRIKQIQEAKK